MKPTGPVSQKTRAGPADQLHKIMVTNNSKLHQTDQEDDDKHQHVRTSQTRCLTKTPRAHHPPTMSTCLPASRNARALRSRACGRHVRHVPGRVSWGGTRCVCPPGPVGGTMAFHVKHASCGAIQQQQQQQQVRSAVPKHLHSQLRTPRQAGRQAGRRWRNSMSCISQCPRNQAPTHPVDEHFERPPLLSLLLVSQSLQKQQTKRSERGIQGKGAEELGGGPRAWQQSHLKQACSPQGEDGDAEGKSEARAIGARTEQPQPASTASKCQSMGQATHHSIEVEDHQITCRRGGGGVSMWVASNVQGRTWLRTVTIVMLTQVQPFCQPPILPTKNGQLHP